MIVIRSTKMAFKSIFQNKMRSFLTMLGIIIGVCSVITLVSVIQGVQKQTMEAYNRMGSNIITAYYGSWGSNNLDISDEFFDKCVNLDEYIIGATSTRTHQLSAKYKSKSLQYARVYLASDTFDVCMNNTLEKGRTISYSDIENKVKVCVLGSYVANEFFGLENPIGKQIKLGGVFYTVIGTYKESYGNAEYSNDNMIAVPRTCQRSLGIKAASDGDFTVKCKDSESTKKAMYFLSEWLRETLPANSSYSGVYSNSQWQEQENETFAMFSLVVGGIAGISLLVGGIGIMNIMLVSVAERTREIGIRMSIGAKRRDIVSQFLIEAAVISACGGLIGIAIGAMGSAMLSSAIFKSAFFPSPLIVFGAFAFSVVLGIFFGFYPANKASKMQPVDALRNS